MTSTTSPFPRASFLRRLAAIVYDSLMAVAIGVVSGLIALTVLIVLLENGVLDKHGFEHSKDVIQQSPLYTNILRFWCGGWILLFFVWFWRNGGQTIGMRAWRLRIFSTTDKPMGYGRALLRAITSLLGLGTLLILLDFKNKLALQDRLSGTEVLVLTKEANHHRAWKQL
ncbi:hypothetical protein HMF8227_02697 [Saliniradius amylolyticus]|uniref:RDD domain-containing protein n=1 Tax=Saliniradius amylolyticus TaxID=2183582 RepID=A0A2S2E666_9ALTE|nr:RDD family protein [Saliniradius amylolyticus]AWL13148.1 hypothetical protein HMF8227_02697 [Saliniradius amylolyticus]